MIHLQDTEKLVHWKSELFLHKSSIYKDLQKYVFLVQHGHQKSSLFLHKYCIYEQKLKETQEYTSNEDYNNAHG